MRDFAIIDSTVVILLIIINEILVSAIFNCFEKFEGGGVSVAVLLADHLIQVGKLRLA
jgi:hypothetical protein